jgi:hypothetical protein
LRATSEGVEAEDSGDPADPRRAWDGAEAEDSSPDPLRARDGDPWVPAEPRRAREGVEDSTGDRGDPRRGEPEDPWVPAELRRDREGGEDSEDPGDPRRAWDGAEEDPAEPRRAWDGEVGEGSRRREGDTEDP